MYRLIAHLSQRMKNIYKILREEALSEQYADPIDRCIFGRKHDPVISKHQVHNCFADHP